MMPTVLTAFVLAAASIAGPESGFAGELVATWVHDDGARRISISLDADGLCSVVARDRASGITHRTLCGYWLVGSTIHLRARISAGPRPVMEATYDRGSDELSVGDRSPMLFQREPSGERSE